MIIITLITIIFINITIITLIIISSFDDRFSSSPEENARNQLQATTWCLQVLFIMMMKAGQGLAMMMMNYDDDDGN